MGSCFSSESINLTSLPTAKIITANGNLLEYSIPVTVSQVLYQIENSAFFLCNSDKLLYGDYIPELGHKETLQENQIYFLLPRSRLQYHLTASDMAALAMRASSALAYSSKKSSRGRSRKVQISPSVEVNQRHESGSFDGLKRFDEKQSIGISRSSGKKLPRAASRRAKLAIRSFRERLGTIYEGSVAE